MEVRGAWQRGDQGKGETGERESEGGFAVQTELLLPLIDLEEREGEGERGRQGDKSREEDRNREQGRRVREGRERAIKGA